MKKVFLVLILLVFFVFGSLFIVNSKAFATDYLYWMFYSNNSSRIKWQIGFHYFGDYQGANETTGPTWKAVIDSAGTGGCGLLVPGNLCEGNYNGGSYSGSAYTMTGGTPYGLQWASACIDPYVSVPQYVPSRNPSPTSRAFVTGYLNITAPNGNVSQQGGVSSSVMTAALNNYAANGGGTLAFGGFSSTANCPDVPTPSAPTLSATDGCTGTSPWIKGTWSQVNYGDYYDFRYKKSSSTTWSAISTINDNGASSFSKTITGVSPSTTYNIQVRAHTVPGVGGPTAWSTDSTTTGSCVTGSWSGLSATPSCNATYKTVSQAAFKWNTFTGASSYKLFWATSNKGPFSSTTYTVPYSYATCTAGPGGCSFSYGANVSWYVQALNSTGGLISTSPTQSFTTANCTAGTYSCQQCDVSNTCQTVSSPSPCATNCNLCPPGGGGSCL